MSEHAARKEAGDDCLSIAVAFKKFEYVREEDDRWIGLVVCGGTEYRVYGGPAGIDVTPASYRVKSRFSWDEALLANLATEPRAAAIVCALSVDLGEPD